MSPTTGRTTASRRTSRDVIRACDRRANACMTNPGDPAAFVETVRSLQSFSPGTQE